jgi:hypothetical protein
LFTLVAFDATPNEASSSSNGLKKETNDNNSLSTVEWKSKIRKLSYSYCHYYTGA